MFQIQGMTPLKRNCGRCSPFSFTFHPTDHRPAQIVFEAKEVQATTVIRVQGVEPNWLLLIFFKVFTAAVLTAVFPIHSRGAGLQDVSKSA